MNDNEIKKIQNKIAVDDKKLNRNIAIIQGNLIRYTGQFIRDLNNLKEITDNIRTELNKINMTFTNIFLVLDGISDNLKDFTYSTAYIESKKEVEKWEKELEENILKSDLSTVEHAEGHLCGITLTPIEVKDKE